jgi:hypothetical protein
MITKAGRMESISARSRFVRGTDASAMCVSDAWMNVTVRAAGSEVIAKSSGPSLGALGSMCR